MVQIMDKLLYILDIAGSLVFVFFAIGYCIFCHELGHFLAAKWRGLHVDAFALGFKPFWRKKYKGVEYRLGWLPFGGYCDIPQVDATSSAPKAADGTVLERAKPIDRIITAVAGPLFNLLSGLLIACIVWICGMPQDTPKMREITVLSVPEKSPEYAAGLRERDRIVKLNGKNFFDTWAGFTKKLLFTVGEVKLDVIRPDGSKALVQYTPAENPDAPGGLKREKIAYPFFKPLIPIMLKVKEQGVAAKAGLKDGDVVVAVDKAEIKTPQEYQLRLDLAGGRPVVLTVKRGGETLDVTVTPYDVSDAGEKYVQYLAGISMSEDNSSNKIESVFPHFPVAMAGIKAGDEVLELNGEKFTTVQTFLTALRKMKEKSFTLKIASGGKVSDYTLKCRRIVPGTIDASLLMVDHPNPFTQFVDTCDMSIKSLRGLLVSAGNKLKLTEKSSSIKPGHMSGVLGMGTVLFDSVHRGSFIGGIYFTVVISFALMIFNLLPLPVLDGGHILFGIIEMIIRRPLPDSVIKVATNIFVVLLIGLMLYVTFYDGKRLFYRFFPGSGTPAVSAGTAEVKNAPQNP